MRRGKRVPASLDPGGLWILLDLPALVLRAGGCARRAAVVVPVRADAGWRLAGLVLRGGRRRWGAGGRLVLWLGPKEPHCLAGVSGGRDGSPAAVPERWSVARACGGAPEPRLRERPSCGQCVAGAGGRGRWFGAGGRGPGRWWPMVRGVRRGSRAVTAAGLVRLRT